MQWSPPVLVLGCHVGAMLDEEPGQPHTNRGRPVQRSPPGRVMGYLTLNEEPGQIYITP